MRSSFRDLRPHIRGIACNDANDVYYFAFRLTSNDCYMRNVCINAHKCVLYALFLQISFTVPFVILLFAFRRFRFIFPTFLAGVSGFSLPLEGGSGMKYMTYFSLILHAK